MPFTKILLTLTQAKLKKKILSTLKDPISIDQCNGVRNPC